MTPLFAVLIFLPVEYTSKSFAEFSMQRVIYDNLQDRIVFGKIQSGAIIRHALQAIVNYDETAFRDPQVLSSQKPETYSVGEFSRITESYPHDTLDPGLFDQDSRIYSAIRHGTYSAAFLL